MTFTWDATAGYFASTWPYVATGRYDIQLGDGDDSRFGLGSFTHTAECVASRSAALAIRTCDACLGSNTWVYRPGAYGQCVPTTDRTFFPSAQFNFGCPPGYLGVLDPRDSLFLKRANVTDLSVVLGANLAVVNPTGFLSGTGTFAFSSRWYTFNGATNGTFIAQVSNRYIVSFEATINLNPWTASISRTVELRIAFPGQLPRSIVLTIPYAPGVSLLGPEYGTQSNKQLIISNFGDFSNRPYFVTQFANPELVVSIRTYITAYESTVRGPRVRDVGVTNLTVNTQESVRPLVGQYWPAYVIPPYNFNPRAFYDFPVFDGVHQFTIIVNEGLPSEERASDWFVVLEITDARRVFANFLGTGTFSDRCNDPISTAQVCFQTGTNVVPSSRFPGLYYPEGSFVKMGIILNLPLPIGLPAAADSVAPAKFVVRYGHQLWFRGEQSYAGYGEAQIRLPVTPPGSNAQVSVGIKVSVVAEQEMIGLAPGQRPYTRNIRIVSAGLVVLSLQIPVYRAGVPGLSVSVDVFFSFAIGPVQEFCNQEARIQPRCNVDPVADRPGWTVAPGYIMEMRCRVQASAGIPFLFSVSIWSELYFRTGSMRYWENGIIHKTGVQVGFRACGSMTVFFYTKRGCAFEYDYSWGEMPTTTLAWKRSALDESDSWSVLSSAGLSQEFQQLNPPISWSSKKKRFVPVSDSGSIVLNTIPTANPVSAAGLGPSRGLAMLAWTGVDTSRQLPQGAVAVFSLYNSTSEKLSDPVWMRATSDSDSVNSVTALPDGRFLVLISTMADQGSTTDAATLMSKIELASVVYDPFTASWGAGPVALTSDGQYFDGSASALVFTHTPSGEARVLATWIRSIDSMLDRTNQKQYMWSVFSPDSATWTAPQVLLSNIFARSPPSMSVIGNTVLVGYIDDNLAENQTVAYLQKFDTSSSQWAPVAVAIGRAYNFVAGTNFNSSEWDVENPLQFTQHSVVVSAKNSNSFVAVWSDLNGIFSRTYSLAALNSLFAGTSTTHPEVQLIWMRKGTVPRGLTILALPDGTQIGQILTWSYAVAGESLWNMDFLRQSGDSWESAPIEVNHEARVNVLHSSLFSATSDTSFAVFSSQEVLQYSNHTEYLGQVSIEYKRITLLPLVQFEDATIEASASGDLSHPFDVRVSAVNKGLLPSLSTPFTFAQGDLFGPFAQDIASATPMTFPSLGPSQRFSYFLPRTGVRPNTNAGYVWVVLANSSVLPMRLPTFTVSISEISFAPSSIDGRIDVNVDALCTSLLGSSSPYRDQNALVPVHVYTRDDSNYEDVKIGSTSLNCSIDGATANRVVYNLNPEILRHTITVAFGALDDMTPESMQILPNITRAALVSPDLQMYGQNQIRLVDPFLSRARFLVDVYNGGLVSSKNVTVNVTLISQDGYSRTVATAYIPAIRPHSKASVDLSIGTHVVNFPGLYNFTIQAVSLVSAEAIANFTGQMAANDSSARQSIDYEVDTADNIKYMFETRIFGAWKPRFGQEDVSVRPSPISLSLWIANAALDTPAVDAPITFSIVSDNMRLLPIGTGLLRFLNVSAATVVSLTPTANASSILSQLTTLSNARVVVSIPPMFSGSQASVEVIVPIDAALSNPFPSESKVFEAEPALAVPSLLYVANNQTMFFQIPARNLDSALYGQMSVLQLQGQASGVVFDNRSLTLTFDTNNLPALPFTVSNSLGLFLPSGILLETYITYITVGQLPSQVESLPPAAPNNTAPRSTAPTDGGVTSQGSNAAGIAIGIIFAIIALVLIVLAILFIRKKHKPQEKKAAVALFFMPWKKDATSTNSVPMDEKKPLKKSTPAATAVGASESSAVPSTDSSSLSSSHSSSQESSPSDTKSDSEDSDSDLPSTSAPSESSASESVADEADNSQGSAESSETSETSESAPKSEVSASESAQESADTPSASQLEDSAISQSSSASSD
jgi:hypothetical protein